MESSGEGMTKRKVKPIKLVGRTPTVEEVGRIYGVSPTRIKELRQMINGRAGRAKSVK